MGWLVLVGTCEGGLAQLVAGYELRTGGLILLVLISLRVLCRRWRGRREVS